MKNTNGLAIQKAEKGAVGVNTSAGPAVADNLSEVDLKHLGELEKKLQFVRDYTTAVATGRLTGYFLWGAGGVGKTHTVVGELRRLGVPYRLFNSRMTGRGLYDALEAAPGEIHLLEDMEGLFRDKGAQGVLRSALGGRPSSAGGPAERLVCWTTDLMDHRFVFTGGIIMTSNRGFPPLPELDAVKTRIGYTHLAVSDAELAALMRRTAGLGYADGPDVMEPGECLSVAEHVIDQCRGLRRPLDMRTLFIGFTLYLQWRELRSGCDWRDLVSGHVKERPVGLGETRTPGVRASLKEQELAVAADLLMVADPDERVRLWVDRTGKSRATLYRRLAELGTAASQSQQ